MSGSEKAPHLYEIRDRIKVLKEELSVKEAGFNPDSNKIRSSIVNELRMSEVRLNLRSQIYDAENLYRERVRERVTRLIEHRGKQLEELGRFTEHGYSSPEVYEHHSDAYDKTLFIIDKNFPGIFQEIENLQKVETGGKAEDKLIKANEELLDHIRTWPRRKRINLERHRRYDLQEYGEDSIFNLFPDDMLGRSWGELNRVRHAITKNIPSLNFEHCGIKALLDIHEDDVALIDGIGPKGVKLFRLMKAVAEAREGR